ncbi:lytic murein transglycosylase [Roseinatronobacter bogoriensis]|uniref:Lytic murein transglycosylase n=1 Tax=Roseinatronobacter bogoriensis subsp. barguzinensis TaxID=441209 RepID=A0A2K8K9V7_9RHOB|nr:MULTISPECIES: lytic murein transglycosylase [Rhodobaca]ATX66232.1 lytic murein transglycosylase [Rhodobaca barguzinensis]
MYLSRRFCLLGLSALSLSACMGGGAPMSAPARPAPMRAQANPAFDSWKQQFQTRATSAGIPASIVEPALNNAGFLPDVIARDRRQAEFTRTLEDYLGIAVSPERLAGGRAALSRHASTLRAIEARYDVEAEVITAIWGLESRYGTERGDVPVISALATLAFEGRRGAFFESQLIAALRILQRGDTSAANLRGSWAGAMGHTQFIPTTYQEYAVDFTGNGRRDIWSEDPSDALASAANYLSRMGWRRGRPWGVEVRLPDGFDMGSTGRGSTRSVAAWTSAGVRDMDGRPVTDHGAASVIIPDGPRGPAFMTFSNFTTLTRYNNSEFYVIGIGHLSDRLRGGGPIRGDFQPDRFGLRVGDRQEIQRRLTQAGFDTQGADGVIGPNSEAAIRAWQQARGQSVTGQPSRAMLEQLRSGG